MSKKVSPNLLTEKVISTFEDKCTKTNAISFGQWYL